LEEEPTSQEDTTTPQPADLGSSSNKKHPIKGGIHNSIATAQRRLGMR
jgi:hypothetical protein